MTALVIAEHDNKSIKGATLNTVTAAAAAGGEVHVLVAGHNASGAAQAASKIAGVTKVLHAEAPGFEHGLAENLAAQVIAIAGSYSHLVFPATAAGKNVAPRVAALLDVAQVSDVTKVISADTFDRPIYAGNAIATVQSTDKVKVLTVRTTGFDPAASTGGSAAVESVAAVADNGSSVFVGSEIAKNDRPELSAAKIIVSGGRAMGSSDKFNEVLTPLADRLGAALGASRAAVDAGYAPNDWQVGQTGKVVAPELYVAIGISGAIQHLAGMKDSKVIVAINKDEDAPIFQVADYGLVADLYQAVPELTETVDGLADCDLVIEPAIEKEEIQRKIFHDVCAVLKPEAIVASNTSSISITRLAASTDRPERFIGIHFMNPVPLMELVELIRGIATDDATFDAAKEFVTRLGKQVAVSEDFPAFIVNRILLPMINEAIYTLYEGVGNVEAIDAAMKLGAHHPMGPLELADFIGIG